MVSFGFTNGEAIFKNFCKIGGFHPYRWVGRENFPAQLMFMDAKPEISPHCRAQRPQRIISNDFAQCLTDNPLCPHLVMLEKNRLCFHPGREQIIAQTPVNPPPLA